MAGGGLQIDDDPEYQRRVWRWQRRAWGGIAAVLAFAAVGGFGDGPLSSAEAGDAARGLVVTYERFGRAEAPSEVEIAARPGPDRRVHLRLGAGFLEDFNVEGLEAYRDAAKVDGGAATLSIDVAPGAASVIVSLEIRPRSAGRARIEVGLEGGPDLALSQFVYP